MSLAAVTKSCQEYEHSGRATCINAPNTCLLHFSQSFSPLVHQTTTCPLVNKILITLDRSDCEVLA